MVLAAFGGEVVELMQLLEAGGHASFAAAIRDEQLGRR